MRLVWWKSRVTNTNRLCAHISGTLTLSLQKRKRSDISGGNQCTEKPCLRKPTCDIILGWMDGEIAKDKKQQAHPEYDSSPAFKMSVIETVTR